MNTNEMTDTRVIDYDRQEHESCERGTPGCCIAHSRENDTMRRNGACEGW